MNNFILMAEIIQEPQLRYTSDTQLPIAEMVVQFDGLREDDPQSTLRVVGWGNLAQEIQEKYHQGDRVVIEGRLHMNTVDRPEGFKEKRAELTAQRLHKLEADATFSSTANPANVVLEPSTPVQARPTTPKAPAKSAPPPSTVAESTGAPTKTTKYAAAPEPDYDDIPF